MNVRIFNLVFSVFLLLILVSCTGRIVHLPERPKLAVYWTSPTMGEEEADSLSRFHMVIADMENMINNRESLKRLKKNNPALKLICYSNPMEFFTRAESKRTLQNSIRKEIESNRPGYLLNQPSGEAVIFWPGMRMLNLSINCPVEKGQKYHEYISEFLLKKVLPDNIWDGYFMDNCTAHIAWIGNYGKNHGIDSDNDGYLDSYDHLDEVWKMGTARFLENIRSVKGEKFIILGNKGSLEFREYTNGRMFEEFPNDYLGDKRDGGWYQCIENYLSLGSMSIIHARKIPNNPRHRLFVLASSLMGDGYYAYAQDFFRYFPEYSEIGPPLDEMKSLSNGTFERNFEKAIVRVDPANKEGKIIMK